VINISCIITSGGKILASLVDLMDCKNKR